MSDAAFQPLRAPFPAHTGRDVRIAVIDSGVHPDHPHIDASRMETGVAVRPDGAVEVTDAMEGATLDRLGHGTAVVAAIQEKAPDARCLPVRVFRDGLRTSAAALIAAIRWAVAREVDLINLSLGSPNAAHRDVFALAVEEAAEAGILIIAAREANDAPCYPGALPGVLGVGLDWACPRDRFRIERIGGDRALIASGYPRPIPGVPLQRNLYGISFAVAQASGFAARACERIGAMPRSRERLAAIGAALAGDADGFPTS